MVGLGLGRVTAIRWAMGAGALACFLFFHAAHSPYCVYWLCSNSFTYLQYTPNPTPTPTPTHHQRPFHSEPEVALLGAGLTLSQITGTSAHPNPNLHPPVHAVSDILSGRLLRGSIITHSPRSALLGMLEGADSPSGGLGQGFGVTEPWLGRGRGPPFSAVLPNPIPNPNPVVNPFQPRVVMRRTPERALDAGEG